MININFNFIRNSLRFNCKNVMEKIIFINITNSIRNIYTSCVLTVLLSVLTFSNVLETLFLKVIKCRVTIRYVGY